MTRELTRFTTNFAGLLSAQPPPALRYQPTLASALGQTAGRLGAPPHDNFLTFPNRFVAPFLQFADALNRPSFPIQLPIGRVFPVDTRDSTGWLSQWHTLTTALVNRVTDNFRDIHNSLSVILHRLSQPRLEESLQLTILGDGRRLVSVPMIRDSLARSQPQALPPSLPLPQAGLFSQHVTTEELIRHQSVIRSWVQPLAAVSAKLAQPTTTAQPHFWMPTLEARSPAASLCNDLTAQPTAARQSLLAASIPAINSSSRPIPTVLFNPGAESTSTLNAIGTTVAAKSLPVSFTARPFQPSAETAASPNTIETALTQTPPSPVISTQPLAIPPSPQPVKQPDAISTTNFNGGIHVQISAQTVDQAHAQETARAIAEKVMQEVNRISERNRFRRGL